MKKLLFLALLLFTTITVAQDTVKENEDLKRTNEVTTNLLDLVIAGSFNVNYERLLPSNQSILVGVTAFDTYGYYDAGYLEESSAISLRAAYLIYFSKVKDHYGFYFYPALKARTGDVTVDDGFYNYDNNGNLISRDNTYKYNIGGFSAGFGLGHKWLFADKFSLSLNGEIFRALGSVPEDEYGDLGAVEPRFGVNFGYRF